MNKQEFIETLEEIRANINRNAEISDYTDFSRGKKDAYNNAIGLAKQIDEPEKSWYRSLLRNGLINISIPLI